MKYFIYALLLIALALPGVALADPPDNIDPENIGVPKDPEAPDDLPIFIPSGITEDEVVVSNEKWAVFRSDVPGQAPLRIRYCPTLEVVCSGTYPNTILGYWRVNEVHRIDYSNCVYDYEIKYRWCHIVGYDPDKSDKFDAGWVAVADADSTRVWISPY